MSSAEGKKRQGALLDPSETKKAKSETGNRIPEEKDEGINMVMDATALGMCANAGIFSGAALGTVKIIEDPQSQFLVMITSNAKASAEKSLEKGNNFSVVNFVVLKALKAGFSSTPYEVCPPSLSCIGLCGGRGCC